MKKITSIIAVLLVLSACKKFESSNDNLNAPEKVNPQFLLSNVLAEASDNQAYWGWHAGNLLAQHSANLEFLPVDRYDLGNNEGLWNETYRLLNDLQDIRESEEGNEAYTAVSQILTAHQIALLTDLWTNVPFFEALQAKSSGNFTPKFDSQEDIYTAPGGILDLLKKAAGTLQNTSAPIQGDLLYNGDLNRWVKLANSLRVRYLVRISKQTDVSAELQALVDEGMLFQGISEEAVVPYLSSSPNQWVIYTEREGRYVDVRMSKQAENVFSPLNDPRMNHYYKPTVNSQNGGNPVYSGIPNGLSRESQNAYDLNDVSLMGSFLRDQPDGVKASFMTYAELQFCLAEAAQKGIISGSATSYYDNGIRASFDHHSLSLPSDYLTNSAVLLDGSADLERIMTQKWIALFLCGYEAWFDIRRTGFPQLTISPDNLNGGVYPVRYRYPSTEQAVNGTNYNQAVGAIGSDDYNSKSWWEK
ncbi:MAG: SusD/RagB family nutrient-binding outer membrane lipoprotein [Bacteroidetes bacterium]|nr:MAG: SusD/RagB family nutrient-binding outer membrane lipoprotein [Bacteroidota bacterium]